MQPIIFMHIAKTAGSFVNQVFRDALGDEQVVLHAEARVRGEAGYRAAYDRGVRYFAGHVYLHGWRALWRDVEARPILLTTLRSPVEHLASHIQWLDHYNRPDKRAEFDALSDRLQRLAARIGSVDLGDIGALDHFLTHLDPIGIQMLDNCQSRYFLCGPGSALMLHDPLTLAHRGALREGFNAFDLVLRQDQLAVGLDAAARLTGVALSPTAERVNSAKSDRRIDTQNPVMRGILAKRLQVDNWLWRLVCARSAAGSETADQGSTCKAQRAAN